MDTYSSACPRNKDWVAKYVKASPDSASSEFHASSSFLLSLLIYLNIIYSLLSLPFQLHISHQTLGLWESIIPPLYRAIHP